MRVNKPKYQVLKTVHIFNYNILLVNSSVFAKYTPKNKVYPGSVSLLCLS